MNTRQPIQPSSTPIVLGLSFSLKNKRFVTATTSGLKVYRSDNCLTTYEPTTDHGPVAIAEALDDRYIAFVPRTQTKGVSGCGSGNVVMWWDYVVDREVTRLDFHEPVLGLRVAKRWMSVILLERTVIFSYQSLQRPNTPPNDEASDDDDDLKGPPRGPNEPHALHRTSPNPYALASLSEHTLILPAQTIGQVQLIPLPSGSKRVLRAHNTALRCIALSPSGSVLATASEQGTLIRVFDVKTLDQIAEFRRGVEKAVILSLAFNPGSERWLACTSDKGTLHVFDLKPAIASPAISPETQQRTQHRKSQSHPNPNPTHRLSTGAPESLSAFSGRSSPASTAYQGSVQEYYGLRPPPSSASPSSQAAAVSALSAFKTSSFAPKVLKDVRSVASAQFYMGEDPPHWQGGAAYSWTMGPDGTRKRVRNQVPALPNDPAGRPPKGIVAFAPLDKDGGVVVWVIGGGSDARWEVFELVASSDGVGGGNGWSLVKRGFRNYLTRQFVD